MKIEIMQEWLRRCIDHENGYWDDPVGGPTNWGISKRSYPDLDIKSLTIEDACRIYERDFINPLRLDRFPIGVAFQLFDFAVNSGPKTAVKQLQQAIGVDDDGVVGQATLEKLNGISDSDLVKLVIAERLDFMVDCKNFLPNARGWVRRMAKNLRYGAQDT